MGEGGRTIYERAAALAREGRPFVLATVVAVRRPTSARPGAHGLIHADGTIEGWVGGSCAQPIVVREALRSLADGEPRLLRISREPPSDSRRGDGIIEYVMTCHSGGTLEIYVEPQLPAPELWVAGTTPIAHALVELGARAGYRVTVVDPIAQADAFPAADRVVGNADLAALQATTSPYIVVATQGSWDEEALESALRREARYVGLVASPTRASVVRSYLAEQGVEAERLAALRAPAGVDLGAEAAEEIAISILAEVIQVRRGRAPFVASPGPATLAGPVEEHRASPSDTGQIELVDPVCGMQVRREDARHLAEHDGTVYAFCSLGCRTRFVKDPTAYVAASVQAGE